jgi:hypothetical protein
MLLRLPDIRARVRLSRRIFEFPPHHTSPVTEIEREILQIRAAIPKNATAKMTESQFRPVQLWTGYRSWECRLGEQDAKYDTQPDSVDSGDFGALRGIDIGQYRDMRATSTLILRVSQGPQSLQSGHHTHRERTRSWTCAPRDFLLKCHTIIREVG